MLFQNTHIYLRVWFIAIYCTRTHTHTHTPSHTTTQHTHTTTCVCVCVSVSVCLFLCLCLCLCLYLCAVLCSIGGKVQTGDHRSHKRMHAVSGQGPFFYFFSHSFFLTLRWSIQYTKEWILSPQNVPFPACSLPTRSFCQKDNFTFFFVSIDDTKECILSPQTVPLLPIYKIYWSLMYCDVFHTLFFSTFFFLSFGWVQKTLKSAYCHTSKDPFSLNIHFSQKILFPLMYISLDQ